MTSKTEQLARDLMYYFHPELEVVYGVRPAWLQNPATKQALEFDIFYPDLQAAIEVNGIQHNRHTPGLHGSKDDFKDQLDRDSIKINTCAEWGVRLYHLTAHTMTADKFPIFLRQFEEDNRLPANRSLPVPVELYARAAKLSRMKIKTERQQVVIPSIWLRLIDWLRQ